MFIIMMRVKWNWIAHEYSLQVDKEMHIQHIITMISLKLKKKSLSWFTSGKARDHNFKGIVVLSFFGKKKNEDEEKKLIEFPFLWKF